MYLQFTRFSHIYQCPIFMYLSFQCLKMMFWFGIARFKLGIKLRVYLEGLLVISPVRPLIVSRGLDFPLPVGETFGFPHFSCLCFLRNWVLQMQIASGLSSNTCWVINLWVVAAWKHRRMIGEEVEKVNIKSVSF